MTDYPISIRNVSKAFRVPLDHSTTLKYRVVHPRSSSRYRRFDALKDVSFDVSKGEFLGITGPNGCGKSTLLKILSNIYRADSGTVITRGTISPFLELGVGFNPDLTARDNIFLGGSVMGLTRKELRSEVDQILDFAELTDFADQKLKNFSSGMQVRLAFAVAIQANADILLMDEVLAVGDARFQEKCFAVFAKYRREGKTVVLVTHDLGAIDRHCDRAILLTHGEVIEVGDPTEVTATYRRMVGGARSDATDPNAPPPSRWGTREVAITEFTFTDAKGNSVHSIIPYDKCSLNISYEINTPIDEFACALTIRTESGVEVAGTNSRIGDYRIPGPPVGTKGVVAFSMDALPLTGGAYTISFALQDAGLEHEFDHIENALNFHVTDDRGNSGLLTLRGSWSDTSIENRTQSNLALASES